ncbi:MAG: SDR family oxidoreductase [Bacteroidota bacterium]|nr:SDR family oxidoreductase [Bacteroidota bacterium]
MQFDGQTVWVTGGRSGIGRAVAAAFAREGATVYISGREAETLRQTAGELDGTVRALPCDVTDVGAVEAACSSILGETGQIDVLVNNAGTTVFNAFTESSPEDFDRLMATNLRGPFLTSRAVVGGMTERGSGCIVMINSMAALQVFPNSSVYAASKGGLKMLTDCLRGEVRASGVRVVSIFPGATDTPIWPDKVREKHGHKMMASDDVAAAVLHACAASPQVMVENIVMQPIGGGI